MTKEDKNILLNIAKSFEEFPKREKDFMFKLTGEMANELAKDLRKIILKY